MNSNPWRSTSVRAALNGLSFIDEKRMHIHSEYEAQQFLESYGFDLEDAMDVLELESLRKEAIDNCYEEYSEHFKTCDDDEIIREFPREYYCGNYVIMWELYNTNEECLSDYHTGLDKYFNLSKISNTWGAEMFNFSKGLN